LGEAIQRAVEDCIEKGILADFLRLHSSEVINMLTAEFILEDALQVWKEEGKKEGMTEGMMKGMMKGKKEGIKEGMMKGKKEGMMEGKKEGIAEGEFKAARKMLSHGMTLPEISKILELPLDQLQALGSNT
jgi:predicted transposase YdaD